MNDKIHIRTGVLGNREEMPTLSYDKEKGSELGYRSDTEELYIGTSKGNKRLCGVGDIASLTATINALEARLKAIEDSVTEPSE